MEDEKGDWKVKELGDWFQHIEDDDDQSNNDDEEEETQRSSPTMVVNIIIRHRKRNKDQTFLALLDTGARKSMAMLATAKKAGLTVVNDNKCRRYRTAAGIFTTNKKTKIHAHRLLELNSCQTIIGTHIRVTDNTLGQYDSSLVAII